MSSSLPSTSVPDISALRERFSAAGQDHLFQFWPELSPAEQSELQVQLSNLDVERVNRVWKKAMDAEKEAAEPATVEGAADEEIRPLPDQAFDTIVDAPERESQLREVGLKAIADGRVGVLLMAGGQGTRLGSSDPKGCYDIGLPSHKSLFQYQAERISSLQSLAEKETGKPSGSVVIPWYVMTSGPTRKATVDFFSRNAHFGLNKKNIIFFEQGTLPCLTMEGKILMDSKSHVAVAPDGNGGLYAALRAPLSPSSADSVLSDLEARKISFIHAYCVDNCLVRVADPVFIGYGITKQADCAAKVVRKCAPTESVGVVALRGDKFGVIEYSEISSEQASRVDPKTGELAFRAANIANHFYTTEFLKRVESFEEQMAFHIARKKIPHVDVSSGSLVKPSKPNGMKLEMFVFDVFPYAEHMVVLEVERKEEFSPLKNAPGTGSDDPETSRNDLLAQQKRFITNAGATMADGVEIEVSPLITYAGEGLSAIKGKTFTRSGIVEGIESFDALE